MAAKGGLEGVVATTSSICHIDGEQGLLSYCGYDIHDLAREATFEEVCHLLWHRRLPTRAELGDLRSDLAAARPLPEAMLRLVRTLPPGDAMDALRTLVSALALIDPQADARTGAAVQDPDTAYRTAVRLTAQVGSLVATWGRLAAGGGPVAPDPALDHAANVLLMLNGERPTREAARALDVALILHADHELNASTFAARVTGATLSDVYSTAVAGIGALKGPLHGGANAEVMRMLLDLGEDAPDDVVERTIRGMLAKKQKVPGFGHRVYRTEDPRATHLRQMSETLSRQTETRWFGMSRTIERVMKEVRRIDANVDFYSASTYHMLGIPIGLFTPIFAVSRIAGWTAHVLEQYANNRLIRPRADYTGAKPPQPFVPLGRRV
ncbi:MAG: citrate synthase [Acidobacteria bacterium]|nr:citrate synthase [Acidobacteriota bacterium]MYJ02907.1 citrate synthase [Acidobacteriota bacterium]